MRPFFVTMRFTLVLLGTAATLQRAVGAEAIDTAAVDVIMEDALKAWQVPGAAIAIVRDKEVVYLKGFGVRELGSNQPVTPQTIFAIASLTKAFTATAMAMLVDEGKLAWDDPVRQHVPFFRLSDPLADREVTLRDLACHRTGLGRHELLWYRASWTPEESVRKIGLVPLSYAFRSRFQYQNISYLAAGCAVASASQSPWEEFVRRRIFVPLGMNDAVFTSTAAQKAADHASPHRKHKKGRPEVIPWYQDDQQIRASGSIKTSVRDLSRWVQFQLGDGTFAGERLVSAAGLAESHTPQMVVRLEGPYLEKNPETSQLSYGLGWYVQDYRGHLLIAHGGNNDGFTARIALLPQSKVGIAILTNLQSTHMTLAATNGIIDHVLGLPKKDWNSFYAKQVLKAEAAQKKRVQEREEKRHRGTRPSRERSAYTGTYEEPAYGQARLGLEGGALVLRWSGFRIPLEHFHFDTFMLADDDHMDDPQVVFALGANGEVDTMRFQGVGFKKVKPTPSVPTAVR